MLFQNVLIDRIIAFTISQLWPLIYFPYFAYKLLKRSRNRSILILSISFINYALVFLIALFSIFLIDTPFSKILYSISLYLFFFNHGLYIITNWLMTRLIERTQTKFIFFIIISYLILASFVFWVGYPFEGLIYGPSTGWRPEYSWLFFWVSFFYVTFFLIIPEIFIAKKVSREFKGTLVENRVKQFTIGIFLNFLNIYFLITYNTWVENEIYRSIHLFIVVPLNLISAYLVYRGIGRALE